MRKLILAIDQGTTGTTALLVNPKLQVLASCNVEFPQIYPRPGWVEHNLDDIWRSTLKAIHTVLNKVKKQSLSSKNILAIGITNQRETACFWNKKTGAALSNAIVWQDRRTTEYCHQLVAKNLEPEIQSRTGLVIDPYFSGSKISWALKNSSTIHRAAKLNLCAFGTIDSYLVSRLTNNKAHVTEPSNASRTLLYNIETLKWDDSLLEIFNVPKNILPEVLDSTEKFGVTQNVPGLIDGIPIHGILGDQQAALFGQACIETGMAKCTYGTGSFILLNTGNNIRKSKHRLLSTVAWRLNKKTTYALEGGAFTAGASVQWVRDGLKIIKKSSDIEKLANTVRSSDGVLFIPAFTGIGAPHWKPEARAALLGMTRGTGQGHIARAVLEGIAMMNHDILRAMEKDLKSELKSLNVDGGACKNNLLMQFQADVLNIPLHRPQIVETTALGAVFAAGLGVGLWNNLEELKRTWKKEKTFHPKMKKEIRTHHINAWEEALRKL